ncbi:MAG: hypothetical protein JWR80_8727 [Bradyrhizobium sp.]|jgi:hypothetical protein|nr:hypothetical protein [Bradyrhizobium sp.]
MEQFHVTKKKYHWIVRHNGAEHDLARQREDAIASARVRAQRVIDGGGKAEILVANTVGMWDMIQVSA